MNPQDNGVLTPSATLEPPAAGSEEQRKRLGVGAVAPPPPPPTALDGRLAEYQRLADDMGALLQEQAATIERLSAKPAKRQPSKMAENVRRFPKRYAVPLCIAGATLAAHIGVQWRTPRLSETEIAAMAMNGATANAVAEQDRRWAVMQAEATQVVVPDPFSYYGRELTEDAKTAIGYDSTTGNKTLNPARSMVVANQVKEALSQQSMTLDEMRLSSLGPSQLRVHNNPAEGYQLFSPPAVRPPDSMTTTTAATTATSAP